MLTALLTRADVARNCQALHLLAELKNALVRATRGGRSETLTQGGARVRLGELEGIPARVVVAQALDRATAQLIDAGTGHLLAVMDARHLSAISSAVLGAVAADVLARPAATDVAILGAGADASGALKALRLVRTVQRVWLYQPDLAASTQQAFALQASMSMSVRATESAEEAAQAADIVVLAGGVRLDAASLRPGSHLTVLQAGTFDGAPVSPLVLQRARRFTDAPSSAPGWLDAVASLGQVIAQEAPGRRTPEDITLFASAEPAYLDLVAAWHAWEGARQDESLTRLDLEA